MQICKYGRMYCVDWLCRYTFHRIISNWSCVLHVGLGFMEDGSQGSGGDGKYIPFSYSIFSAGCCWLVRLTSVRYSIHCFRMKWLIVSTDSTFTDWMTMFCNVATHNHSVADLLTFIHTFVSMVLVLVLNNYTIRFCSTDILFHHFIHFIFIPIIFLSSFLWLARACLDKLVE